MLAPIAHRPVSVRPAAGGPSLSSVALVLALLAVWLAGPAAATPPFYGNSLYVPLSMSSDGPAMLVDLDGDGRLDLVRACRGAGVIAVRLGLGGAGFAPTVEFPVGSDPLQLAIGDIDGDLELDAAVPNFLSATVTVLYGNGDGTFGAPVALPIGPRPVAVTIADLDLDGRGDLVVGDSDVDELRILRSIPGGFAAPVAVPTGAGPVAVAVGRLDADAWPDLAVTSFEADAVSIHLATGGGAWAAPVALPAGSAPNAIELADLDGDGDRDLVVGNFGGCCGLVSIFSGHGDGTYDPPTNHGFARQAGGIAVHDLDADGIPEILATSRLDYELVVLRGADGWSTAGHLAFPAGDGPGSISVADLDGDALPDAIVGGPRHFLALLRGRPGGTFETFATVPATYEPNELAIGDLDGDGALDLIGREWVSGATGVALGNGDGTFQPSTSLPAGVRFPLLARLDGDADLDLIGLTVDHVGVLLGNGDGTFAPRTTPNAAPRGTGLALGDLNDDGRLDVVVTSEGSFMGDLGEIRILLGNGDGTFTDAGTLPGGPDGWKCPVLTDLDLDGALDLLAIESPIPVTCWPGNGDGTFGPAAPVPSGIPAPGMIATGRFDANATPDLVIGSGDFGIEILPGLGDGSFGAPRSFPVERDLSDLQVGDLDGDGRLDLAMLGVNSSLVIVARGDGAGGVAEQYIFGSGATSTKLRIGDLNGDSRPDLIVSCWHSAFFHALFNEHPGYPTPVLIALASVEATPDRVRLLWSGGDAPALEAVVERRSAHEEWRPLAWIAPDGTGLLRYEDRAVAAGGRYAYRLSYREGDESRATDETWVSVPSGAGFALHGARPQPATTSLRVAFSLPGDAPARVELFDAGGRRVLARDVGALGAGEHVVDLTEPVRLAPGLYFVRLTQGDRRAVARVAAVE